MRANLWLRSASRVIVRVARFRATAFHELERHARRLPWDRFLASGDAAEFRVTARKSKLYHSDAIAQRFGEAAAKHASGRAGAARTQRFIVRALRDEFEVSVDSSGELLHRRGYRQAVAKAPLRETLAAALLLSADWDGGTPLIDPFCGSGTIPIEAALLARRIAPGRGRSFAFMEWPEFDAASWNDLLAEARDAELPRSPAPVLGSDRDAGGVSAAAANAERAGVAADIEFSVRALAAIEPPPVGAGLVATNPPYGVRLSGADDLRDLYAELGNVLRRRVPAWRVALITPDPRFRGQSGLSLATQLTTTNGGIRVRFLAGSVGPRPT